MRARWLLLLAPAMAAECPPERSDPDDPILVEACPEGLSPVSLASAQVNELVVNGVSTVIELVPERRYTGVASVCSDPAGVEMRLLFEANGAAFVELYQRTESTGSLDANGEADLLSISLLGDVPATFTNGAWQNHSWLVEREQSGVQIDLTGAATSDEDNLTIQALIEVYP